MALFKKSKKDSKALDQEAGEDGIKGAKALKGEPEKATYLKKFRTKYKC